MKFNEQSLREKGWNEEEITHAKKIMETAHKNRPPSHKYHKQSLYWFLLIMILSIGVGGAYLMGALILFVSQNTAYLLIGITGLMFGTFAGIVVKDIEDLEKHHHLAISIIIPITAIMGSMIMSKQVSKTADYLGKVVKLHPFAWGLIFSVCILIPYGIFMWLEERKKK